MDLDLFVNLLVNPYYLDKDRFKRRTDILFCCKLSYKLNNLLFSSMHQKQLCKMCAIFILQSIVQFKDQKVYFFFILLLVFVSGIIFYKKCQLLVRVVNGCIFFKVYRDRLVHRARKVRRSLLQKEYGYSFNSCKSLFLKMFTF